MLISRLYSPSRPRFRTLLICKIPATFDQTRLFNQHHYVNDYWLRHILQISDRTFLVSFSEQVLPMDIEASKEKSD